MVADQQREEEEITCVPHVILKHSAPCVCVVNYANPLDEKGEDKAASVIQGKGVGSLTASDLSDVQGD